MTKEQRERLRLVFVGACTSFMLTLAAVWHQWMPLALFAVVAVANTVVTVRRGNAE